MDTREFLLAVVPWTDGYLTIHGHRLDTKRFSGRSCRTIDEALAAVAALKNNPPDNIYFCLSRQRLNSGIRERANATELQALWVDADVHPKNPKTYATLAEAIAAIIQFCDLVGIPRPSIIVASGGGLHVYWLSDRPLPVNEWQVYADALKTAIQNSTLKIKDIGVIGDAARVLRVPDTINYKYTPPQPVRLLQQFCNGKRHDFKTTFAPLLELVPAAPLGVLAEAFKGLAPGGLADGIDRSTPPIPFIPLIKDGCGWLREAHDTGGEKFDQPQWNLTTLAATFMEDGNALAHAFGNKHPEYRPESTENLWDRKNRERRDKGLGWPSCRAIQDAGSQHCKSCPHLALDKSPLHLGLAAIAGAKEQVEDDEEEIKDLGGKKPQGLALPNGFCVNQKGKICAIVPGKKLGKGAGWQPPRLLQLISNTITNPILQLQDGSYGLGFTSSTDKGNSHEVFIPSSHIYVSGGLLTKLAARCVLYDSSTEAIKYLDMLGHSWLEKLTNEHKAVRDSGTLGWRYDGAEKLGFAFGGVIYKCDGTEESISNTTDDEFRRWYMPKGTKEAWLRAAKLLTDRKRPELDILISIAFAAPLMAFCGNIYGCILSVWGEPGTAKSTAQQVAAAVWGHPKQTRESLSSTPKSVQGRLGRICNLPAYWDDIQDERHQDFLCTTMFAATQGTEAGRLNADASYKERKEWQTMLVACSNASFVEFLIKKQKSTTAGMRRVLEFSYNRNKAEQGMIDELDASRAFAELEHNHGMMGVEYCKLITEHHKQIDKMVTDVTRSFKEAVKGTADESFWWNMCGVLIVGAKLANQLGASLDVPAMIKFLGAVFEKNRHTRGNEGTEGGSYENTERSLVNFLNMHSGQHAIYTNIKFRHRLYPIEHISGPGSGKPVFIQVIRDERKILISKRQFREYLQECGIQARQVLDGLQKYFGVEEVKATLGAGTALGLAQEACLEMTVPEDMDLLDQVMTAKGEPKLNGGMS